MDMLRSSHVLIFVFFFQAEDGIRDLTVTGVQTCALPISTVILLAHDPRRLDEAAALNVPLVLSGHTHGGQVVLPGLGAIAAKKFPVVAGVGRRDNTSIFVSRGVGTVYVPYRLNCPPDVSVIKLQSRSV